MKRLNKNKSQLLRRILLLGLVFLFSSLVIVEAVEAASIKYPKLFGSRERRYKNMKAFKKWTGVLDRYDEAKSVDGRPCDPFFHEKCELPRWSNFIESLDGKDTLEKINAINAYHNNAKYLTDPVNWKLADYWETPDQFFKRNGDCEDYAIAKYLSLRKAGVDPANLRVLVVQDLNLNVGHAILVVYNEGRALILDNQVAGVIDAEKIKHYKIQYSINENYWWRHR